MRAETSRGRSPNWRPRSGGAAREMHRRRDSAGGPVPPALPSPATHPESSASAAVRVGGGVVADSCVGRRTALWQVCSGSRSACWRSRSREPSTCATMVRWSRRISLCAVAGTIIAVLRPAGGRARWTTSGPPGPKYSTMPHRRTRSWRRNATRQPPVTPGRFNVSTFVACQLARRRLGIPGERMAGATPRTPGQARISSNHPEGQPRGSSLPLTGLEHLADLASRCNG